LVESLEIPFLSSPAWEYFFLLAIYLYNASSSYLLSRARKGMRKCSSSRQAGKGIDREMHALVVVSDAIKKPFFFKRRDYI